MCEGSFMPSRMFCANFLLQSPKRLQLTSARFACTSRASGTRQRGGAVPRSAESSGILLELRQRRIDEGPGLRRTHPNIRGRPKPARVVEAAWLYRDHLLVCGALREKRRSTFWAEVSALPDCRGLKHSSAREGFPSLRSLPPWASLRFRQFAFRYGRLLGSHTNRWSNLRLCQ